MPTRSGVSAAQAFAWRPVGFAFCPCSNDFRILGAPPWHASAVPATRRRLLATLGIALASLATVVVAEARKPKFEPMLFDPSELPRSDGALGRLAAPTRFARGDLRGGTIAADETGLWIAERNAGALIRADHAGEPKATIPLHEGLGELLLDRRRAALFVADRRADRILRYATEGDAATLVAELAVTEPHGLALTPDGATLLATSVANGELLAIDAASMTLRWRAQIGPEPRAVVVTPDGRWAYVGLLARGAVAKLELAGADAGARVEWLPISPRDQIEVEVDEDVEWGTEVSVRTIEAPSRFDVPKDSGRRHARNVFALGFVGDGILVAPHQLATSQMELRPSADRRDAYGGGAAEASPLEYRFARIAEPGGDGLADLDCHDLQVHQPRALAYDRGRDLLFIAGYGDDELVAIGEASRERPLMRWRLQLEGEDGCGIDGLALVDGDGPAASLWIHCELSRNVVRVDLDPDSLHGHPKLGKRERLESALVGPELAPSLREPLVERGAELFRRGESWMLGGPLACSSCHPEGRSDGLSWRLGRAILQTPILAGRLAGTAPYKWTGEDRTLRASFIHTLERIGGDPEALDDADLRALEAYLTSLPKPRPPTGLDAAALARGRVVFDDECSACHEGEASTDRERHEFATSLRRVDTPSLIGLAHSAPYYHDGSAIDLPTLLDDRGSIHDMIDSSGLSAAQRQDLIVYLRSL